jgi:hypothetical protein
MYPASAFERLAEWTLYLMPGDRHKKNRHAAARLNLLTFIGELCKRAAVKSGINGIATAIAIKDQQRDRALEAENVKTNVR